MEGGLEPLRRNRVLEHLAQCVAKEMAAFGQVRHSDPNKVRDFALMEGTTESCNNDGCSVGENVARAATIRDIHNFLVSQTNATDRINLCNERHQMMGVGIAKGKTDNLLYMCQIFRGCDAATEVP
uniref:SCP domain-containing protein n=1 Tax=Grammatophora oceanica TaxID=210454 RepID=A0A7S1UYH5_9STRA